MQGILEKSRLGATCPHPVPGLEAQKVLVMTRLSGFKVGVLFHFGIYIPCVFMFGIILRLGCENKYSLIF
jgi:hypothetical protein